LYAIHTVRPAQTGCSRKTRDVLVIVILIMMIVAVLLACLYVRALADARRISGVLTVQGGQEITQAQNYLAQLSRAGGSRTTQQIGQLRQHLYAIQQLNQLTQSLLGGNASVAGGSVIRQALDVVSECESRLLKGQAIDEQLQTLRALLDTLGEQVRGTLLASGV